MRANLTFAIKLVVSISLVVFLFTNIKAGEVWDSISLANPFILIVAFILYIAAISIGCVKWWLLLKEQSVRASYWDLLSYTFIGLFFGNFLPSNVGGDVVRAFGLARFTDEPEAASISVLVDRIIGLLAFIGSAAGMSVIVLFFARDPAIEEIAIASAVVFSAGLIAFLALLSRRITERGAFVFRVFPQLSPLKNSARKVYTALQAYRHSYTTLAKAVGVSLAVQVVTTIVNYLVSVSLGLDIPFLYFFLFNPLIAFVLLVPISINGIGLKQTAFVFFYTTLTGQVTAAQSLSLSLLMHSVIILSGCLGGVFWFRQRGTVVAKVPETLEAGKAE